MKWKKWLRCVLSAILNILDDAAYVAGLVLIAVGAEQIYHPAGLITLGTGLIAYALIIARK